MKLHFYDDSIDGSACGSKSEKNTDNGLDVTCEKCRKIVAKLHAEVVVDEEKEEKRKETLHNWAN